MQGKWTLVLVLAVAALAFAAGRRTAVPPAAFDPAHDLRAASLSALLGLSEAQAATVRDLEEPYLGRVKNACDAHCVARCELAVSMDADAFDTERARRLVDKMCEAHKANEMATIEHIARIREVLKPEQRAAFFARIGKCLCESCEPGGAACCAATHVNETKETTP